MIQRQPGHGAVAFTNLQAFLDDGAAVGREARLGGDNALRLTGAAGRELDVGQLVRLMGECGHRFGGQVRSGQVQYRNVFRCDGGGENVAQGCGGEDSCEAGAPDHLVDLPFVGLAAAESSRKAERCRNDARILAGHEGHEEVRRCFGDQAEPGFAREGGGKTTGHSHGAAAQAFIGKAGDQTAIRAIKIDARQPFGRVIQRVAR